MTRMKARSVTSCIGARAVNAPPGCWPAGRGETAATGSGLMLAGLVRLLPPHLLKGLRVVDGAKDIDRALLLQGQDDGIARPGVDLDDLFPQLVIHAQNDAGKIRLLPR